MSQEVKTPRGVYCSVCQAAPGDRCEPASPGAWVDVDGDLVHVVRASVAREINDLARDPEATSPVEIGGQYVHADREADRVVDETEADEVGSSPRLDEYRASFGEWRGGLNMPFRDGRECMLVEFDKAYVFNISRPRPGGGGDVRTSLILSREAAHCQYLLYWLRAMQNNTFADDSQLFYNAVTAEAQEKLTYVLEPLKAYFGERAIRNFIASVEGDEVSISWAPLEDERLAYYVVATGRGRYHMDAAVSSYVYRRRDFEPSQVFTVEAYDLGDDLIGTSSQVFIDFDRQLARLSGERSAPPPPDFRADPFVANFGASVEYDGEGRPYVRLTWSALRDDRLYRYLVDAGRGSADFYADPAVDPTDRFYVDALDTSVVYLPSFKEGEDRVELTISLVALDVEGHTISQATTVNPVVEREKAQAAPSDPPADETSDGEATDIGSPAWAATRDETAEPPSLREACGAQRAHTGELCIYEKGHGRPHMTGGGVEFTDTEETVAGVSYDTSGGFDERDAGR